MHYDAGYPDDLARLDDGDDCLKKEKNEEFMDKIFKDPDEIPEIHKPSSKEILLYDN
jgi:hypothetical protein